MDVRKAWACLMPAAVMFPYKRDNKSHAKKRNPLLTLMAFLSTTNHSGWPFKGFAPWLREIFAEIKKMSRYILPG